MVSHQQLASFCVLLTMAALAVGMRDTMDIDVMPFKSKSREESFVRTDPTKSVAMLNRHTFHKIVDQQGVDDWIVLFCVDWLPVCQGLWHQFQNAASQWEDTLSCSASSWQSTAVRFAEVGCTTDKALCNENGIEDYPSVLHFQSGELVDKWELHEYMFKEGRDSAYTHLSWWINKELHGKLADSTSSTAKTYTEVGIGYCIDAGGQHPEFVDMKGATYSNCRKRCNSDSSCVGYDFRPRDGNCNVYVPGYPGSPHPPWIHNNASNVSVGPLTGTLLKLDGTNCFSTQSASKHVLDIASDLEELSELLSSTLLSENPITHLASYCILAVAIGLIAWVVGTGLCLGM